MDDIDFIEEQPEASVEVSKDEQMRLKVAFGDDVAQRFLKLRGIHGEIMQEAVLERYAQKQAARLAREAIAVAVASSSE